MKFFLSYLGLCLKSCAYVDACVAHWNKFHCSAIYFSLFLYNVYKKNATLNIHEYLLSIRSQKMEYSGIFSGCVFFYTPCMLLLQVKTRLWYNIFQLNYFANGLKVQHCRLCSKWHTNGSHSNMITITKRRGHKAFFLHSHRVIFIVTCQSKFQLQKRSCYGIEILTLLSILCRLKPCRIRQLI